MNLILRNLRLGAISLIVLVLVMIAYLSGCTNTPPENLVKTAYAETKVALATPETSSITTKTANNQTQIVTSSPLSTFTSQPTYTNQPTYTPQPTYTARPTYTSLPTDTIQPTSTIQPISTQTPRNSPASSPDILSFIGNDNDVIDITRTWQGPGIIHFVASGNPTNFIVEGLDKNGKETGLLANAITPYDGFRPLDFETGGTTRLVINTNGPWEISIYSLTQKNIPIQISVPGSYQGNADSIVFLSGAIPDLLKAKSFGDSNFMIWGYDKSRTLQLIVNEIAPSQGTYIMPDGVDILVIEAKDKWEIQVTSK